MLSAERAADLPVQANGAPVAKLNSRGAAAFTLEAKPRSELKVVLETHGNPRASEQDPRHTFVLPETSAVVAYRYPLVITPPPPPRRVPSKNPTKGVHW